MSALASLFQYDETTRALDQIAGRLGWDQETMMPRGAAEQRGAEMAAMESVLHARKSAPEVGDWLAKAEPETDVDRAKLRVIQRDYDRATKVPADLATEIAKTTSIAQGIWAAARASEDLSLIHI